MLRNDSTSYIQLGTAQDVYVLNIPNPKVGLMPGTTPQFETVVTANGETKSWELGRSLYEMPTFEWARMSASKWWQINKWIQAYGPRIWVRFFNHDLGEWQQTEYYITSSAAGPNTYKNDLPDSYRDCKLSFKDTGAEVYSA